jgi:hypothetical protein
VRRSLLRDLQRRRRACVRLLRQAALAVAHFPTAAAGVARLPPADRALLRPLPLSARRRSRRTSRSRSSASWASSRSRTARSPSGSACAPTTPFGARRRAPAAALHAAAAI